MVALTTRGLKDAVLHSVLKAKAAFYLIKIGCIDMQLLLLLITMVTIMGGSVCGGLKAEGKFPHRGAETFPEWSQGALEHITEPPKAQSTCLKQLSDLLQWL